MLGWEKSMAMPNLHMKTLSWLCSHFSLFIEDAKNEKQPDKRIFAFWLRASGGKGKLDLLIGSRILFANRVHFGVEGDILIGEYNWMHNRLTFS